MRVSVFALFFAIFMNATLHAEEVDYHKVETYINEFANINSHVKQNIDGNKIKQLDQDFGTIPKEQEYRERELTAKAQEKLRNSTIVAEDQNLTTLERAEAGAAASIKESYRERPRFDKLDQESWVKKSDEITRNPIVEIGSACKISGEINEEIKIETESYEVEVDDEREIETEETCEEDGSEIHQCERKLSLKCESNSQVTERSSVISHSLSFRDIAGDVNREGSPYHFEYKNLNLDHTCLDKTCFAVTEGIDDPNGIAQFDVVNVHLIKEFQLSRSGRAGTRCSKGNCKEGNILGGKLSINGTLVAEGQPSAPKNLVPYLKEGRNQISVFHRDFHTGHSYYWVITYVGGVRKECNKWQETWEDNCGSKNS